VNVVRTERHTAPSGLTLTAFVLAVSVAGVGVIAHSVFAIRASSLSVYGFGLAVLTIVSDRFAIKIPGRPAKVSVSEFFVFASILLCGSAVPVLTVAVDGLWISLNQRDRRLYRTLFNIAEPAVSTWIAAQTFFAVVGVAPGSSLSTSTPAVVLATVAMAAAFFALNSGLSALAVALESGESAYTFWRSHGWCLAVNDYAAASLATLAVSGGPKVNWGVAGLVVPLLLLSYVAYREASGRVDEAQRHIADVERLYHAAVEMLAIAVDTKDQVTHGHIRRVQRHTLAVAAELGVTDPLDVKAIDAGALLHDIGKLAVPDYVLNKPSALTTGEFEIMKNHANMGARILRAVEFPYPVVPIVRHHHERWDGRGYPDGLVGSEIPLGARILAVVDCFDALTSTRPYRAKLTDAQAIEILQSREGTFYDPTVVCKFIELIPELRRRDAEAGDVGDAHASVVAGLTRGTSGDQFKSGERATASSVTAVPLALEAAINSQADQIGRADACLFAFDTSQDALNVAYATPRIRAAVSGLHIPLGSGVSGWVAANRSTIRGADPALDLGGLAGEFGLRVCVSVPVFVRADLFGVLTVYVRDAALSDDGVDAVALLAQEIGLLMAGGRTPLSYSSYRRADHRFIAAVS
jgi:putative nucleotidyltransferase with HDIG domain